jgi:FG-GAP repeat
MNWNAGDGPISVAAGDFNGDGRPDLTVANFGSDNVSLLLNTTPLNRPPMNSVPAAPQTVGKIKTLTFSHANGSAVSVADPDASTALVQVTLTVLHGSLTLAGTAGVTFQASDGRGDRTVTFPGTIAAVNAALDGLRYAPDRAYTGATP